MRHIPSIPAGRTGCTRLFLSHVPPISASRKGSTRFFLSDHLIRHLEKIRDLLVRYVALACSYRTTTSDIFKKSVICWSDTFHALFPIGPPSLTVLAHRGSAGPIRFDVLFHCTSERCSRFAQSDDRSWQSAVRAAARSFRTRLIPRFILSCS